MPSCTKHFFQWLLLLFFLLNNLNDNVLLFFFGGGGVVLFFNTISTHNFFKNKFKFCLKNYFAETVFKNMIKTKSLKR